jgi:hypothetical protein
VPVSIQRLLRFDDLAARIDLSQARPGDTNICSIEKRGAPAAERRRDGVAGETDDVQLESKPEIFRPSKCFPVCTRKIDLAGRPLGTPEDSADIMLA